VAVQTRKNCNVAPSDINYSLKLNGGDDNIRLRVRVVFNNIEKKKQIMKSDQLQKQLGLPCQAGSKIWPCKPNMGDGRKDLPQEN
jgi:hypothetical protein